ncbi:MAG: FixH family protein [Candidatus Thiodiazotropha endolucinida]|nr:FixH family protein [Candidatus Thiodiazotropha taylori]MCG8093098.1 FixH family protein [Candidatus Thiodiazotropha endolucinida]MCG8061233.1 FixH family protein [Candidatus Thiodiazotropha taylori]MCG8066198.1 FixH family protein [Candidatus Thiodiazotropha taylori]MCW4332295.1 FixH family protein [Candidatus Thiodiazotropha endolucinida]
MTEKKSAWQSPWVIAWVAMVVIFFTMNMIMIYFAIDNNPGLVVDDFYERGEDYEENMLKKQARNPGWIMSIDMPRKIDVGQSVVCRFTVKDKVGNPISRDGVTFYAYRPSDAKQDFSVAMNQVGPGEYEAEVSFPLKGAWDALVSIKNGEDEYNTPKRIGVGIDWIP